MAIEASFNWSLLDRYYLYEEMNSLRRFIVGKRLTPAAIHSIISKHIKKHLPIKITKSFDTIIERGYIYIGGVYHSDYDQEYRKAIEISFNYNPNDTKLKMTDFRWKRICMLFADTVLHEVIHMRQYRVRNFKLIPEYHSNAECSKQRADQNYYGDRDEIDAYGFNLACELYDRFGTDFRMAMDYLENGSHKKAKRSVYYKYLKAFDFNQNHKVIKKLKKRVAYYLPYTIIGKPFKTADWLYS